MSTTRASTAITMSVMPFNAVRLWFNIVLYPVHLSFKPSSTAIMPRASSSSVPCMPTGSVKWDTLGASAKASINRRIDAVKSSP